VSSGIAQHSTEDEPLGGFLPATRRWFAATFAEPTRVQVAGWRHIQAGEHTLLLAPTGSGKTLAAFLACIDRLARLPATTGVGVRVLYVSPLKALAYDIERNLRAPLGGIEEAARALGATDFRVPRIAVRTGDTPARDRRSQLRAPGDILITTPESLYLMLGSSARETLRLCDTVIVDEIHALAPTKRGAHLALSLERLEALTARPPQRIGLSATQRPLDEIGRFLVGGGRPVALVDTSEPPRIALAIEVPVDDMESARPEPRDDGTTAGQGIWASIHPRLVELVRQHRSTIIFVNSRRLCERLAESLNLLDGGEAPLVRAHHGSVARAQREAIEQSLKAGEVRGLVATSSLELGIDMGAVDLVIQIESPGSVARGLQRIGRAGHAVGALSQGRIFPKHRADLLESAVVAERMLAGAVEAIRVPQNPLDVLAQQLVAMVSLEPWTVAALHETVTRAYGFGGLSRALLTGVLDMLSGHYPSDAFADLRPRLVWDRTTDVLTARRDARLLALVNGGTIPDRGLYAVHLGAGGPRIGELDEEMVYECRAGETFLLGATSWRIVEITRDRVIVQPAPGEPGKMPFWRGEGPGRSLELGRALGAMLRETVASVQVQVQVQVGGVGGVGGGGGPAEGIARLEARFPLDARAARNLWGYIDGQRQATGTLPTDRELTIERFRDELGDWRVCILSPFGARVHAPWALALEARLGRAAGFEVETLWSDDGIVLRFADTGSAPDVAALIPDPAEVSEAVLDQLPRSAMFAAHFRENAARALLLPRRRPGARTPLWAQRLRSETLMAAALRHPAFPIVLETFRECVQDVFDLPALRTVLEAIARGEIRVTEVETPSPSPFARSLAFAYVAAFMYEGDSPLAERKAQALTLDRTLLRELLGQDELSTLLDPGVMDALEAELQALEPERRAHHAEALHDLLRRIGDLTEAEVAERTTEDPRPWLAALEGSGRAVWVAVAGQPRVIAAEDAGRYRDGLGVAPPSGGVPARFLEPVPDARVGLVARFARTHGPFAAERVGERFGLAPGDVAGVLRGLEVDGTMVEGAFRPGLGDGGQAWCHAEVLRILRRRTLARLRTEVAPVGAPVFARFLADWHGVQMSSWSAGAEARSSPGRQAAPGVEEPRRGERLREAVARLEGMFLPFSDLERRILPARLPDFEGAELDALGALGEICWVASGALGRGDGRIALFRRDRIRLLLDPPLGPDVGAPPLQRLLYETLQASGASFFAQLRGAVSPEISTEEVLAALWELVWAGLVTNDTFQPLRALAAPRPRAGTTTRHPGRRERIWAGEAAGRWSTVGSLLSPPVTALRTGGGDGPPAGPPAVSDTERLHARARMLLDRYGVVSREMVAAEGRQGGFSELARVLRAMEDAGKVRRGFFVDGLVGAQFALPNAVERLRAARAPEAQALAAASSGPGAISPGGASASVLVAVLAAVDPANPYGAVLPWPEPKPAAPPPPPGLGLASLPLGAHERGGRAGSAEGPERADEAGDAEEPAPARRAAGARVVLVEGTPVLFIEGGGRALRVFSSPDPDADIDADTDLGPAVAGLRHALHGRGGRPRALRIERVNGTPALRSALSEALRRVGFRLEPGALVLDPPTG
jgi:ATP-dependent Lhr-like helicase